jgi:hypothetical protein
MSYDLIFCREKGRPLAFEDVAAWALGRKHFERSGPGQIWYENEKTGVYFSLEYENFDPEDGFVPSEYEDIRLSFSLNFFRPNFFAYEAMPVVCELAKQFELLVIEDGSPPAACDSERYIATWTKSNAKAVAAILEGEKIEEPFYIEANKSLAWWRYMYRHEELTKELEEADVFVPNLFLFGLPGTRVAQRAIVWTTDVHLVVPECDVVVLGRKRKSLFRTKEESGIVSFRTVSETLGNLLEDYDAMRGLRIVRPENLPKVQQALANIPFSHAVLKEVTRISPDRLINAENKFFLV